MIVTSTQLVEGRHIADYLGVVSVRGSVYRGGSGGVPRREHQELHQEIMADLIAEAESLGADALVGVSVAASGKEESVIYIGTAVRLARSSSEL